MTFKIYKEVAALPALGALEPDAVYAVRVGTGFDFYITNGDAVPFELNVPVDEVLTRRVDALEAALPDPGTTVGTLTNPPLSLRLGVLDNETSRPFVNFFKQVWAWEADTGGTNWDALVAGGFMTAGGQLISIAPGSNGFRTRLFFNAPAVSGISGRWRLRWTGTCTIDLYGAASVNRDVPNEITFDFTANGSSWIDMVVRTIDPAGGQIRDFRLVHQDDWEADDAGAVFRARYLDEIRNARALRFDEWTGILRNLSGGGLRITTWESRPLVTDEIFYRFVPYEWMIELCELVGADTWLCLPTAATLDHFQQAAILFRDLTPPDRYVYAEYSTKTWDFSGTAQAHYCAEQGRIAFGTTEAETRQEFRSWYAMRTVQMAQIWRQVWGDDPRLKVVIQHQADWMGGEHDILTAPMWQERDGTLGLPPYVAPHTVVDVLTVHAQIDGGMAYGNRVAEIEEWRTTLPESEAFDRMRNQMLDARYFGSEDPDNRNVANLATKWAYFREVADERGLELASYEVGNHLNVVGGSGETAAFIQAFSVSAQMGEVYAATIEAIRTAGFDGPLAFAVEARFPDTNISHGLQRWLGDHNPAWEAVDAINQTNDGPAGRGATDFIGTYEAASGGAPGGYDDTALITRIAALEQAEPEQLRTVNGQSLRGIGNLVTSISFTTDADAAAFSAANPGISVFSTQVT